MNMSFSKHALERALERNISLLEMFEAAEDGRRFPDPLQGRIRARKGAIQIIIAADGAIISAMASRIDPRIKQESRWDGRILSNREREGLELALSRMISQRRAELAIPRIFAERASA